MSYGGGYYSHRYGQRRERYESYRPNRSVAPSQGGPRDSNPLPVHSLHIDEGKPDHHRYHHHRDRTEYTKGYQGRLSRWDSAENSGRNTPLSASTNGSQSEAYSNTNTRTGVNQRDLEYNKLAHHRDCTRNLESSTKLEGGKNYKVMYDPELDPSLSKSESKLKSKKVRFNGEGVDKPQDPRLPSLANYLQKPNKKSSKFPFKQLPQAKFIYDLDSIGEAPLTTLVIWDLPISINETFLKNFLASFESGIENLKTFDDPKYGVPLGVATFKYQGSTEKSNSLAEVHSNR